MLGTADQRREQMLRAALEVIAERGYADTRIADVAERTGISPALVIYYFKTKDQLLTEAIRYLENVWYTDGQRRMAALPTDAARIEEIVAMSCLPEADAEPRSSWTLWLDFWALAARNPGVGTLRRNDDERWRELISSLVTSRARRRASSGRWTRTASRSCSPRCWTGWPSRSPSTTPWSAQNGRSRCACGSFLISLDSPGTVAGGDGAEDHRSRRDRQKGRWPAWPVGGLT